MRRIAFFVFLLLQSGAVIMLALLGCERTKVFTVGIVNPNAALEGVVQGFISEMSKSEFTEGKDVTYIYGGPITEAKIDSELTELSARKVDLILAVGTLAARKAKEAVRGSRIPVVFASVLFPVES